MHAARRLLPVAALLLLSGCKALDPVALYRAAARQLHFSLEKVDPKLELAFPLERSKVRLNLNLGVENRSSLRLASRVLGGKLHLDQDGVSRAIGFVSFPKGIDLAPSAKSSTGAEIALSYADLKDLWEPLMAVIQKKRGGTFRLDGEAQLDVMGFPVKVPLRASKRTGE
jgi:hypothetical protein